MLLLIFRFELFLLLILCPATTDAIRSLVVDVLLVLITGADGIVWIFCIFPKVKFIVDFDLVEITQSSFERKSIFIELILGNKCVDRDQMFDWSTYTILFRNVWDI